MRAGAGCLVREVSGVNPGAGAAQGGAFESLLHGLVSLVFHGEPPTNILFSFVKKCAAFAFRRLMKISPLPFALTLVLSALAGAHAAPDTASAARQIDSILEADWKKNNLQGNPAADDNSFVRRIYLDTIGRIPTAREAGEFLSSTAPDKRARLIDKLLASEGYTQHFFNYWSDVLRIQTNGPQAGPVTGAAYADFIKQSLRTNKPYDQMVRDMVAAQGKAWDNGAIGYYMRDRGMPLDNMANTVRVFLGTRIECAQCHNHPFDKWSQMQFYQMAAYTYNVDTQDYYGGSLEDVRELLRERESELRAKFKEPQRPRRDRKMSDAEWARLEKEYRDQAAKVRKEYETARQAMRQEQRNYQEAMTDVRNTMRYTAVDMRNRNLTLPHDYQYSDAKPRSTVQASVMMGHECATQPGETPLQAYARWMTSKDNPRFTSVIASRLWKKAFGLALIEPLDELMDTSTPMIPELQTHLEGLMKSLDYDMKAYLRVVFNTSAYQRQVTREEVPPGVAYHFTGPLLRRMTAEQMWDSFVTLINPNPDMPNLRLREDAEQRILQAKKNADGVDALSVEEALRGIKLSAAVYDKNRERTEAAQKLYLEARIRHKELQDEADSLKAGPERDALLVKVADAKKKSDDLRRQVNDIQNEGRRTSTQEIIVAGHKKLYEVTTGKPWQPVSKAVKDSTDGSEPAMMASDTMMMAYGVRAERVTIPGYDRPELSKDERKAREDAMREEFSEEARFYGLAEKELRDYFRSRETQNRTYVRAAEEQSPAPRGHPLRDFGQSDRETIENANYDASVPQSLFMMNGSLLPNILHRHSQLMLTINKAQYPDDKVEAAYMALLARKPTSKEMETWNKAADAGLDKIEDLVYALLNTQQFIFIQ